MVHRNLNGQRQYHQAISVDHRHRHSPHHRLHKTHANGPRVRPWRSMARLNKALLRVILTILETCLAARLRHLKLVDRTVLGWIT